jgi:hypothetical protein
MTWIDFNILFNEEYVHVLRIFLFLHAEFGKSDLRWEWSHWKFSIFSVESLAPGSSTAIVHLDNWYKMSRQLLQLQCKNLDK